MCIRDSFDALQLTWRPVINPPSVSVNGGVDDIVVKEDGSVDVPVVAELGANAAPGEFITVTVTGIDSGWGFSAPLGTYDSASGVWSVTLPAGENLDTVLSFTPPSDSDVDLSGLEARVVATDPAINQTASAEDDFNVIVDAVSDAPSLSAEDGSGEEGTTIPVTITTVSYTHLTLPTIYSV